MALPSVLPFQPIFSYPNNKLYQYEAYPVLLSCNFVVDSTNGNGLGIRNLKGSGVANVFMHTSATPAAGNYGVLNPNPASGIVLVQLQNQFSRYLSGFSGFVSPLSGSNLTATTNHVTYVVTGLGTATLAQWQAVGYPLGMTPTLGAAFVATATGTIGGSATVQVQSVSGIQTIEIIGDPNATLQNSNMYQYGGAQLILQTLAPTVSGSAYDTPMIPTAPANNSVLGLNFYLSNSSVTVNGQ